LFGVVMIDKRAIVRLVEELDKFYVTDEEDYESFIYTLFHDDPNPKETNVMDNAYHLMTSHILLYFATLGLDVQEEINKRDDLIFAKINRSLEDNYEFKRVIEKEFEVGVYNSFEQEILRRLDEKISKYEEEQDNG
jgi:hypothetical protein